MGNRGQSSHPTILALDTSSNRASMAVARGPSLIASLQGDADEKRSERLWAEIDSLLGGAGVTINEVDLFSVCIGPGGFTGLRVGIAAIKGFASANSRQIIGVTSLEAAALSAGPARNVFAILNATRGEVYSQLFNFDLEGVPVAQGPPVVTSPAKALEFVAGIDSVIFAGDWTVANSDFIREVGGDRFREEAGWSVNASNCLPAEFIAEIAYKRYIRGEGENPEQIRACYVRPSEAEIKLSEGVLGSKIRRVVMQK
ncbi:MAG TPA: tRNA (adenosine(37)-N6)-threonylcarbamoyltransferase complex dimerization subunit type 1 TsaB [Blastocatellia bacterium]|nr:tRNA (adenosine(37)-N6)-threonylcarbamoyltransferase complex dimerization subunit type 1 TsaB [Blastocatellia bacterium]